MKWVEADGKYKFVWNGDERQEVTSGVIRRLKILELSFFKCPVCKTDKACPYPEIPCEDCLHDEKYQKLHKGFKKMVRVKTYRDAVAFGQGKDGKPLAVDSSGRLFSESETIYAKTGFDKDPNGWKATGKRVTDPDYGKR